MNRIKTFINYLLNILKNNLSSIIGLVIVFLFLFVKLDYSVYAPGGAINIEDRLSNVVYDSKGSFNLTYVSSLEGRLSNLILGLVLPDWDIVKNEDIVIDNETMEIMNKREVISLYESISSATYVAYSNAGIEPNITSYNYYVYYVADIANTTLEVGDKILEYDGKSYDTLEATDKMHDYINSLKVGDKITFKILRDNKETNATAYVQEEKGSKLIGIMIDTIFTFENDPDVSYAYRPQELGSSGGLMLSLAIYNAITEKDITNGLKISGTGTISIDGTVGEIGGVRYKIMGAVNEGCDVFIVPSKNYKEAKKVVKEKNYKIKLIKADTFEQVLSELNKIKEK